MNRLENLQKLPEKVIDGIAYTAPTWEQMGEYNFQLAQQIIESGQKFDRVIALAKGGWTWSRALVDYLNISQLSSIRLKSYTGINQSSDNIDVIQQLHDNIKGENVLIFDDVADSGKTLKFAIDYVKGFGAETISTATLCYKPRSIVKPDFYAFSTESWVIFPHEIREFIKNSSDRWCASGTSYDENRCRLVDLRLPENQIDFFLPQARVQAQP
ncbi:MAG: phosphoribosyltransferase [Candidatus Shapirobacteria bacterium]|nr:phosphoribosyltransferase [Candidatus Shapirobacteria bacterium]